MATSTRHTCLLTLPLTHSLTHTFTRALVRARTQDQLFEAIDQGNIYKAELEQFYALPNPTGIGLLVS